MSRQAGSDLMGILRGAGIVAGEMFRVQEKRTGRLWRNSSIRSAFVRGSKNVTDTFSAGKSPQNLKDLVNEAIQRASMVTVGLTSLVMTPKDGKSEFSGKDYLIYDNMVLKPDDIEKLLEESYPHSESSDIREGDEQWPKDGKASFVSFSLGVQIGDVSTILAKENRSLEDIKKPIISVAGIVENGTRVVENVQPIRNVELIPSPEAVIPKPSEIICASEKPKHVIKTVKFKQELSDAARERKVPSSRLGRVLSFGSLAAGLGLGTVAEVTRRTLGITGPSVGTTLDSAFLNQANAERIVNTLCKVRGAALKLGQLLSIQDNNVISPVLQHAFERVRQSADFMPQSQIKSVLKAELGPEWEKEFADFEMKPFAAASIGQVHKALLTDGRLVAVKIQYPGVAKGINSDIDNLVSVLSLWNIFPEGLFIDNIVEVAKRELAWEVDYVREAKYTKRFKELLSKYPDYYIPDVVDHLSTGQIFTTELIDGVSVDKAVEFDEITRIRICRLIMDLCLKEIFQFRLMQTDPNWSNFFYDPDSKRLILLDFGSSRSYDKDFIDRYLMVIKAAADGDRKKVLDMSKDMKFLTGFESKAMEEAHVDTVMILGEIFNEKSGEFDFGRQDTTTRVTNLVPTILHHRLCPPPEQIYSLHRKLSGVFLLCSKLRVRMDCRPLFLDVYNNYRFS